MADDGPHPVYLRVLLHFRGGFVHHISSYEGENYLVTNIDFVAIDLAACIEFLERFIGETCEKLVYSQCNQPLETRISGDGLTDLFDKDSDESGAVTQCDEHGPSAATETLVEDLVPHINDDELEQEIGEEPQIHLNKTMMTLLGSCVS
ncbi:hypothetical protein LXL04_034268 [Taraxacum kok-saghyz]